MGKAQNLRMGKDDPTHIVALDRTHDGLFLYFADGTQAFYSDVLLHSMANKAQHLRDGEDTLSGPED